MKLRIVSGFLKGRFITVPDSKDFRPTLERTRESIAEIIKFQLEDKIIADVCAGSGAMGFELLSRGAAHVDFIEKDRNRAELIKKNAVELGVAENCTVIIKDVRSFLTATTQSYDIIYYDPPYDNQELKTIPSLLIDKLNDQGVVLYEYRRLRRQTTDSNEIQHGTRCDSRTFGDTIVDFYCK